MEHTATYSSPLGKILLSADEAGLTGLWFVGAKYAPRDLARERRTGESDLLAQTKRWLDVYFSGRAPDFTPPLRLVGTPFQLAVWELLRGIPYGQTATYGALAGRLARQKGLARMSAQAVGGAVGRNKISLIVPCHRVVGADGSLTGYAGGMDKKAALLRLEGVTGTTAWRR